MPNVIATICARGGSKGLPGKNIRAFAGRPLIVHTILQALRCEHIAGVYVSTDDQAIADIEAALSLQPEAELVVSVTAAHDNPYFNLVEAQADGTVRLSKGDGSGRRQDVPAVYALNGSIYVWQRAALAKAATKGLWSVQAVPYEMPRWKSVDIDDLEDFEYAEWLLARHGAARGG